MQDQEMADSGQAEIERVRRQVRAMHERIRAITPIVISAESPARSSK